MKTRIYIVVCGGVARLVDAPNISAAVRHVASDMITAEVCSQKELVRLIQANVAVEVACVRNEAED